MPIVAREKLAVQDLSTADFELTPKAGRAHEITDIGFTDGGADVIAEIRIAGKPIIALPISHKAENLALVKGVEADRVLFFDFLKEIAPEYDSIKISQGRKLRITTGNKPGKVWVRYNEWDEPKEDFVGAVLGENTPKSPFFSHGGRTVSVAAGSTARVEITENFNPKEFYAFPFADKAPAGRKLTLFGVCVRLSEGSGANIKLNGVQFVDKTGVNIFGYEEEFIDPAFFKYPSAYADNEFYRLVEPLTYMEDDEMWIYALVQNVGAAAENAVIRVTLIFNNEPAA